MKSVPQAEAAFFFRLYGFPWDSKDWSNAPYVCKLLEDFAKTKFMSPMTLDWIMPGSKTARRLIENLHAEIISLLMIFSSHNQEATDALKPYLSRFKGLIDERTEFEKTINGNKHLWS